MTALRELMAHDPVALPGSTTLRQAAQRMRDRDIGAVLVLDGDEVVGIATDRDIVVRGVADHDDVAAVRVDEVCTRLLITAGPDDDVDTAVTRMREAAVRRIAVLEDGRPVGVFSLGDAALEQDPGSALADISAAPADS
ncbi:CBS domain-containing protein [Actinokineospora bangkokensis]|uniref:Oxidoreductase n=1 Tax=Actinokineospora bangkokensis TaxID=1193682 RepID=A0A1Q9LLM1_9PSEU|nr:CBS domain-containing protein [Actinokineospora bangkokensis]OLR92932.1 oxidoreductase [Actinokineospora bangkokensis]